MADPRPPDSRSTYIYPAEQLLPVNHEAGTTYNRASRPRCLKPRPHWHRHNESWPQKAWPEYETPATEAQLVKVAKEERARFESAKIQEQKESKAKDSHHFRQDTRRSDSRDYKPKDGFSHRSYDTRPWPGPYERGSSRQALYHNREENPLQPRYQDREEPWYQTAGRYPDEYLRQPYDQYAGQSHRPPPGPYDDRFQRSVDQCQTRYPAYSQDRLHSPPARRASSYMDEAPHRYEKYTSVSNEYNNTDRRSEHRSYTGSGRQNRRIASPEDRSGQTRDRSSRTGPRPSQQSSKPLPRFRMADRPDLDSSALISARLCQYNKAQTENFAEASAKLSVKKDDVDVIDMTGNFHQDQYHDTISGNQRLLDQKDQEIQEMKQQLAAERSQHQATSTQLQQSKQQRHREIQNAKIAALEMHKEISKAQSDAEIAENNMNAATEMVTRLEHRVAVQGEQIVELYSEFEKYVLQGQAVLLSFKNQGLAQPAKAQIEQLQQQNKAAVMQNFRVQQTNSDRIMDTPEPEASKPTSSPRLSQEQGIQPPSPGTLPRLFSA